MLAWVAIVGVFSFARLRIGVVCRGSSPEALVIYACVMRLGDVIGTISIVDSVSVCRIFRRFDKAV